MQIEPEQVAVVTGGGSGIGRALAERFAAAGMNIVLADVDEEAMAAVASGLPTETLTVRTDVTKEADLIALADATMERFGAVHVVCNNAGVTSTSEVWTGPLSAWEWVMAVNFWGVVHGIRAFLPHLIASGGGHIVNTSSIAGLTPGFSAPYDASKHAVLAVSEDLYLDMQVTMMPVGVSVLCPGWVNTNLLDGLRNWPADAGPRPEDSPMYAITGPHLARALAEGLTPAAVADEVFEAVLADRFLVLPQDDFFQLAVDRWARMSDRLNPVRPASVPGMPSSEELMDEVLAALATMEDGVPDGDTEDGAES